MEAYDKDYMKELADELATLADKQDGTPFISSYRTEKINHLRQRVGIPVVMLDAEEIAVGDYSPEYGTVKAVETKGDNVFVEFVNGTKIDRPKDAEIEIDQGGRFDHYRDRVTIPEEVVNDEGNPETPE